MKIAVVGSRGLLGSELVRQLGSNAVPLHRPEFDLTRQSAVRDQLRAVAPDAIVNCAAYTAVDRAEDEPEECRRVNVQGVTHLAAAASELKCPLVQVSTDYVFGGRGQTQRPYREDDPPQPQGVYAISKFDGEQEARKHPQSFIVRTCGLYGGSTDHSHFVATMLRLAQTRSTLKIVADQQCTPTYAVHLAASLLLLLKAGDFGTYHVTNSGSATWLEFAREIFRIRQLEVQLEGVTTEQWGAAAPRPRYSVLDTGKFTALRGSPLPDWREALAEYLRNEE